MISNVLECFIISVIGWLYLREYRKKYNITYHDNRTVSYRELQYYVFDDEASIGLESDVITTANVVMMVRMYSTWTLDNVSVPILMEQTVIEINFLYILRRSLPHSHRRLWLTSYYLLWYHIFLDQCCNVHYLFLIYPFSSHTYVNDKMILMK